ncbi:Mss4-like protein [Dipodascopsis uninucleata]
MQRSKLSGGCECGACRYEICGNPYTTVICHCKSCQRQSGSAFGTSLLFESTCFRMTQGNTREFRRQSDSGAVMHGFFCPSCGTRLYNKSSTTAGRVIVKGGTLDDTSSIFPLRQLWVAEKQPWLELRDVPHYFKQT